MSFYFIFILFQSFEFEKFFSRHNVPVSGNHKILGQVDDKLGAFNMRETVRKEMIVTSEWWKTPPIVNITVAEYQLYDVSLVHITPKVKRRLLCSSKYHFYEETEVIKPFMS